MLARAKSFQATSSSGSWKASLPLARGGNRSEKTDSPPPRGMKPAWRRESSDDDGKREADLLRIKEEIVKEVREEVIFTFTFTNFFLKMYNYEICSFGIVDIY